MNTDVFWRILEVLERVLVSFWRILNGFGGFRKRFGWVSGDLAGQIGAVGDETLVGADVGAEFPGGHAGDGAKDGGELLGMNQSAGGGDPLERVVGAGEELPGDLNVGEAAGS